MYSEASAYYAMMRSGVWAQEEPEKCLCRGNGWALSEVDTWHKCSIHYMGQTHPESCEDAWPYGGEGGGAEGAVVATFPKEMADDDIPF